MRRVLARFTGLGMVVGLCLFGGALAFAVPWYAALAAMIGIWLYSVCFLTGVARSFIDFIKSKEEARGRSRQGS